MVHERMLAHIILGSPTLHTVVRTLEQAMPGAYLAAGCIAQTLWNKRFEMPPLHGIKDLDIVYFNGEDLHASTEKALEKHMATLLSDIPLQVDVKNEARVHLWYAQKFGYAIEPYKSCEDAIASFPTTATAVGVRLNRGRVEVCAPYGLSDLFGGIVRANKRQIQERIYHTKADAWRAKWPRLQIVPWDEC